MRQCHGRFLFAIGSRSTRGTALELYLKKIPRLYHQGRSNSITYHRADLVLFLTPFARSLDSGYLYVEPTA